MRYDDAYDDRHSPPPLGRVGTFLYGMVTGSLLTLALLWRAGLF